MLRLKHRKIDSPCTSDPSHQTFELPDMAANDYYHPSPSRTGRRSNPISPNKALPPDPYTAYNPQPTHPSPPYMTSSFEDTTYHPYAEQSQQSLPSPYYSSGGGGREYEPNPFSDDVPLRQYPDKGDSGMAMHDPLPDDPTVIDRPLQSSGRKRQKKGFFARKQPWVVYIFTFIQVVVFIAELIKNGRHKIRTSVWVGFNMLRYSHKDAHRNSPFIQSNDRSLTLCSYQHGRPLCSMYAQHSSRPKYHYPVAMPKLDILRS